MTPTRTAQHSGEGENDCSVSQRRRLMLAKFRIEVATVRGIMTWGKTRRLEGYR